MDDMMDIPPNIKEDIKPSLGPISDQAANTTIDASPKSLDTNHTMSVPFNMSKSSAKTTFDPSPKKRSSPASGTFVNSSSTSYIMPQPFSPEVVRRLLNPPPTNRTMNACVLIMDDTIRFVEWLAYHYTVLPLGHLVVAIDPNSKRIDKIDKILNAWREYITIDAYYNDTFLTLGPYEGWGRQVWGPNHRPRGWFKNQNGITHRSQAHKRRQNFFSGFCFRDLYEKNKRGWTILTDTDEFVTFNYRYPETEDPTRYDSETKYTSRADVDRDRARVLPFRDLFANMTDRVTIAQYLETYDAVVSAKTKGRRNYCMRIPGLTFSSRDSDPMRMARDFASGVDGSNLMTLRQRQHAAKDGSFSKAMLHLRTAGGSDWFKEGSVVNVHTPNRRMCGRTKKEDQTGSGADYISSLFRIHHYKAGTVEAYLERAGDWRGGGLWRFYFDRNVETVGENSDLTHWFKWFVDKVGKEAADRLLLQPLNETYNEIGNIRHITEAKEKISKLVPGLLGNAGSYIQQEPAYYTRTNLTIGACMYILDDTVALMEWLAYHYTVLPLSHLILGLDPMTRKEASIDEIIHTWKGFVTIEKYTKDSWLADVGHYEGWEKRIHPIGDNVTVLDWFLAKNSHEFIAQVHKRRKNVFIAKCLRSMKDAGHDWVLVTDSDEFVIFNYISKDEDPTLHMLTEVLNKTKIKEDVEEARSRYAPIRRRLPPFEEHVTIADFIHAEDAETCYQLPSLNFSAHQDEMSRVELPPAASMLLSLQQHRTGRIEQVFSKMILDVSKLGSESLDYRLPGGFDNNRKHAWDCAGGASNGTDYNSSVLRLNHYAAGSAERYAERHGSMKGSTLEEFLNIRHFNPVGENRDIDYWIDWFITKVGIAEANRILFKPLTRTYRELAHISDVKRLKSTLADMGILPNMAKAAVVIDDEGNADEDEEDGT